MTIYTQSTTQDQIDLGYETSTFTLGVGIAIAAIAGLWGSACIVSALVNVGPMNVLTGYFTALIG